jgi:8-oxo-dGTP pyrophosphatase MutT (NUDIX family)
MKEKEFITRFHHIRNVVPEQDYPLPNTGKPAGVLIPIVKYPTQLSVLLTKRSAHLKHHPGQISFPGGRQEDSDVDAVAAAIRETNEEIGISPHQISIVGRLPNYRTISGYEMVPVVGLVDDNISLDLDHNEVDTAFEVPLNQVLNRNNHLVHWINRDNRRFPIFFIPVRNTYIWGATAAILRNLSHHIYP